MKIEIYRSEVEGGVAAPPSKSYTHRALICSALARGKSRILSPLYSDDTEATFRVLTELGVDIHPNAELWEIEGGELHKASSDLFCGESATTLRFMSAVCALVEGESRLTCGPSLSLRPVEPLMDGLRQLGVKCRSEGGFPPTVINGSGRIGGGEAAIRGDISSQFVSALLLVSPLADRTVSLRLTTHLESRPYVSMTLETLQKFGVVVETMEGMSEFQVERQSYLPVDFTVERDWSSAAFLLAAGGLAGDVTVEGLISESLQADAAIVDVLKDMGAQVEFRNNAAKARSSSLQGVEFDLSDCPDLFPVVAILCAAAEGTSVIHGVERLRFKESNRIAAMEEGLRKMGIEINQRGGSVAIVGGRPQGCVLDPRRDHRIAMAFAVLGLVSEGRTTILDAGCVSKSFPGFWGAMETLGADFRRIDYEQ